MQRLLSGAGVGALSLWLAGCGYIGPVRPPSPKIPVAITDLTVREVGDQLSWAFTLPAATTDQVDIDRFHTIELRAGPDVHPFDFTAWQTGSTGVTIPPAETTDEVNNRRMTSTTPVNAWEGEKIAVAVRTAAKKERFSSWSNVVHLRVVKPLTAPEIEAVSDAKGAKVVVKSQPPDAKIRILRQGPSDTVPQEAGVTGDKAFIDSGADYGTRYLYTAVAFDDTDGADAVSKPSEPFPITPVDKFPPQVPTNLTALPGPNSIEVSWERSPDLDLKGYRVLRSVNGGAFEQLGEMLTLPTYSDTSVKRGSTYRYEVKAVDERGNISDASAPVEVKY